ncbi:1-phosphatidylinositol-3-phosphate 5-kinase FAB1A-like isoform X1 [Hordeum vulgare subsp. vulgare]|uniref:1-phosphatidylinositol-3-phosphate 5-kinase FAB1A-like isoform X1 n=1 Tax=Hordeum vulgare subsp. vulgare TaxID=112509 RepID=UPI000B467B66|nr:1-phosphatidylinositol-3-phosphate 5-kinase FAB1A-like isoform X1 [Hordeum vulgare subsp. vulgare]XP_044962354.1 1-phosphatidylinositol-3-phosphate 5-kinase FAB1A-like isoform X1 [Hordeum vulgare subsp. vulgare]
MCPDMNPRREVVSEVLDGNLTPHRLHDADHLGQNRTRNPSKSSSNNLYTDDNFFSDTSSLHKHEDVSSDPSASSVGSGRSGDDSDGAESTNGKINNTDLPGFENYSIWIPPKAADKGDETDSVAGNIAYDDDDDDYGDGIKWGQSSFPATGEEHEESPNPRDGRENAMLGAMNGQLKILVSRFLASAGIPFGKGESTESWLDIVTSLSWEAALLIKPDAKIGNEMDPGSYIKVKCVASGTRWQSEVIKGLVFKKNTAHKHMPTNCHNPRLLLLKGVLGHSDVGLSSFNSMDQEKGHLERTISKVMEICSPNVIMVEKTVSRDIQELLLKEGCTLILDMKLSRLQRIARCTGSPIISFPEVLDQPKLKQCDYFHTEKFIEEHNIASEGGKRLSKTLTFLEGFPRPLGCTILLRGANTEELKKVKQVMHYTVFAAYHLILETSFFEDQRVFLNDKNTSQDNYAATMMGPPAIDYDTSVLGGAIPVSHDDSPALRLYHATSNIYADGKKALSNTDVNDPILVTDSSLDELREGANIPYSSTPLLLARRLPSPVSGPLREFTGKLLQETTDNQIEGRVESSNEIVSNGFHVGAKVEESAVSSENLDDTEDILKQERTQDVTEASSRMCDEHEESPVIAEDGEHHGTTIISKENISNKDQAGDALDSHSILVLTSSQCIKKQVISDDQSRLSRINYYGNSDDQSRLSRINYYGNSDVSLGRYLQDILQNQQKPSCSSCEAHIYSYTHQNGNLTVRTKHLVSKHGLPGESEGKIWMWTRCLRCEHEHGVSKSTPRVLISSEARNLSFGKFLELSFSSHSAARRLSICGHLVNRDCLRFFGLGSNVAMFRYSSVQIYTTCKPQPTLHFENPSRQNWFEEERRHVLARGMRLFVEVASLLQHLKNRYHGMTTANCCTFLPVTEFSELEDLLMKDKADFEDSLVKTINQNGRSSSSVHELLNINWSYQDILLELYAWDHRLHELFNWISARQGNVANGKDPINTVDKINEASYEIDKQISKLMCDRTTKAGGSAGTTECTSNKICVDHYNSGEIAAPMLDDSEGVGNSELSCNGGSKGDGSLVGTGQVDVDSMTQIPKMPSFEVSNDTKPQGNGMLVHRVSVEQERSSILQKFRSSDWGERERWIWSSFHESQLAYRKDIQIGNLEKFRLVNCYSPSHLSPLFEKHEEIDSPQFTVGSGGNILCVFEHEISSIIALALAISEDRRKDTPVVNEAEDARREHTKTMEKSYSILSESSIGSSPWSSIESEASMASSISSYSSGDLSGFDTSPLLSVAHPEIPVNGKVSLKGKYSVTSIHADKFYVLRKKCCPSELAYITSLSRCKKWDAQGGKSKALFAKTLDDRFIIKQIKKTEFESFIKFADDYFSHAYHSLDTGSQTCLAKILGIYQVKQIRHGKEIKVDLMVMENLMFGHNISRIYDLKGAMFSRHITNSNDPDTVYLDQNFVEDMNVSPIYIGGRTKHLLQRAIWNDTSFLTSVNVMDYSLLVGVDKQKNELVFGIIDYLRQYTWDKQLETWAKSSLVPKNVLPTVISPKDYKKRFRKFMGKYFLAVPDTWGPENFSGPYKSFGHSNNKLVEAQNGDNLLQHPIEADARV